MLKKCPGSKGNKYYLSYATEGEGKLLPHEKTGRYLVIKHALFPLEYFLSDALPLRSSKQCSDGTQAKPVLKAIAESSGIKEKLCFEPSDP